MKKYLISFTFRGFTYEAKLHIREVNSTIFYDISVLNSGLMKELENITPVFVIQNGCWTLSLIEEGELYFTSWTLEGKYISNDVLQKEEVFSLS